jgi:hypothetical protein
VNVQERIDERALKGVSLLSAGACELSEALACFALGKHGDELMDPSCRARSE